MEITIKEEQVEEATVDYSDSFYRFDETVKEEPCCNNLFDAEERDPKESIRESVKIEEDINENRFEINFIDVKCSEEPSLPADEKTEMSSNDYSCSTSESQLKNVGKNPSKRNKRSTSEQRNGATRTGKKRFICTICKFKFLRKSDLSRHVLTHTLYKPFYCEICEYASRRKLDLNQHMLTHTGERPFHCTICKYQFARKTDLSRHMSIHTDEKPFHCTVCEHSSRRKLDLNQHMLTHTGEKPFHCTICDYKASRKSTLNIHVNTHK